jgi:recombination associated protein RdgC
MFKNILVFRIDPTWVMPTAAALEEALGLAPFVACGPTQRESNGWIEPRGEKHGAMAEHVGGQVILKLQTESKSVPGPAVKAELEKRCAKIEQETGRKPGAKQKRELKGEIEIDLLPRAFSKTGVTTVWIDPQAKMLVVGAGSASKADKIINVLVEAMQQAGSTITLRPVATNTEPATAMSQWLATQEAPFGFTVDRECELKQADASKSTVRYSHHTLEIAEIVEHIKQGKVPTKLALTWNERVSFMLTDDLGIKKIEILNVVLVESRSGSNKADNGFDADVAIATGELAKMLPALFDVLGGERKAAVEAEQSEGEQGEGAAKPQSTRMEEAEEVAA